MKKFILLIFFILSCSVYAGYPTYGSHINYWILNGNDIYNLNSGGVGIGITPNANYNLYIEYGQAGAAAVDAGIKNTTNTGAAFFTALNDDDETSSFGIWGSSHAVTTLRNNSGFSAENSVIIMASSTLQTGGTEEIVFMPGGWNRAQTERFVLDLNNATFNDLGVDSDFRVETAGEDSAFVIDGADGDIYAEGLGSGSGTQLSILSTSEIVIESSSERFKNNIEDWIVDSDAILNIQPRQFNWKESGKHSYGLVAEEVAELMPEIVLLRKGEINSWDERKMIVYMITKIQEQQKQIDKLNKSWYDRFINWWNN